MARRLAQDARWWRGLSAAGERSWQLLAEAEPFEAWAIAWPPGGAIELHDHGGSAAAVVVALGELTETRVALGRDGIESWSRSVRAGRWFTVAPSEVHDVANLGFSPAVSVHVYSPRLSSMRYYALEGKRLVETRSIDTSPREPEVAVGEPFDLALCGSAL